MDPVQPPKASTRPLKPVLFILLGAAIPVWLILQRNKPQEYRPTPKTTSANSMANDMSVANPPILKSSQTERVERYPMLLCPSSVSVGQEFSITVSLTEQRLSSATILNGDATPEGKLVFTLPSTGDSWKLSVDLSGDGLEFSQASRSSIDLPRHGNASAATFVVKASPEAVASGVIHVIAIFGYNNAYLAYITRDIKVTSAPQLALETSNKPTVTEAGSIGDASAILDNAVPQPDMTMFIRGNAVQIFSPYVRLPPGTLPDLNGFVEFLAQRSPASSGRGSQLMAPDPVREHTDGFGEELYDHYAPDEFKRAFWELVRLRGKNFRTIQIYSDKPDIPWELMRPVREDGTGRQDFLGLEYSVARWDTNDGVLMQRPPYSEAIPNMFVIAPHYTGDRSLDGEASETRELAQLSGYSAIDGNRKAVKALFRNPPPGIVHFAGHGELDAANKEFEILLEDGALDVTSWRSMAEAAPLSHTFFFFNACDVGQAMHTGNFVDGFGPAVLSKGASGYIGALWPVNDKVAAQFSVLFYRLIQQQLQTGPADVSTTLQRTRREIYQKTGNPTALAYVLYGDTNLKFVK